MRGSEREYERHIIPIRGSVLMFDQTIRAPEGHGFISVKGRLEKWESRLTDLIEISLGDCDS